MTLKWLLAYCVLINVAIFIWYAVAYDENGNIQLSKQGIELFGFEKHSLFWNETDKTAVKAPIIMIDEVPESELIKVKISKN
ncbi:MAG: hypothetical protein V7784_21515 [Oceanospirillaceae bacterium]